MFVLKLNEYDQEMPQTKNADQSKEEGNIRNRNNQVPHLTKDTAWESNTKARIFL